MNILSIINAIGDFISSGTSVVSGWIASAINIPITDFQSKLITLIIFGIFIWLFTSVLSFGRRIVKYGVVILSILLFLSVLTSIFI